MKKLIFLLLLVPALGMAQVAAPAIWLAVDSSYASSDTTAWVEISPYYPYTLAIFAACDTVNVAIYMDYRPHTGSTTTYATYNVEADSTNYATAGVKWVKGVILRSITADNIPGGSRVRLRVLVKTTKVDSGTKTYSAVLLRRMQ